MFKTCFYWAICIILLENKYNEIWLPARESSEDIEDKENNFAVGLPKNLVLEK